MLKTTVVTSKDFFNTALNNLNSNKNRKEKLQEIAVFIANEIKNEKPVNLNWICTHNSRRSQLAQVWSHYAIFYFNLQKVESFSGGTSVTSFFRNTVKTLKEVGFQFQLLEFSHQNPEYIISYENCNSPIIGFSKLYDHEQNKKPYIAITTCSNADENCPFIPDAIKRFHVPFNDPKKFDNTLNQPEKYLEISKQIAGEVHYIFKLVKNSI